MNPLWPHGNPCSSSAGPEKDAAADLCQLTGWSGCWWVSPLGRPPSPQASERTWRAARRWCAWTPPPVPPSPLSGWCRWRHMRRDRPGRWTGPRFWRFSKPSETGDESNAWGLELSVYGQKCTVCSPCMYNVCSRNRVCHIQKQETAAKALSKNNAFIATLASLTSQKDDRSCKKWPWQFLNIL